MNKLRDIKIKEALRCPICKSEMGVDEDGCGVLFCSGPRRHAYDFSSGGYVNLAPPSRSNGGDSKGAVRARSGFLDTDHYRPIAGKLCEILGNYCKPQSLVVDAGCGEGYYSTLIAKNGFSVAGFDLSKFAIDTAAKRASRTKLDNAFFGVASVYTLPLADKSVSAVTNVFAPCVESEYCRILDDTGVLIVAYAGPEHLLGLKQAIYEKAQVNEERADLPHNMHEVARERLNYTIKVEGRENLKNLFAMTPYYWKTSPEDFRKLDAIDELNTTIDIIFTVYKKSDC